MNVLDIYPNFTWWFEGRRREEIEALRSAAQINESVAHAAALEKLAPARAFHLVGDAATFDLISNVFDEIVVRYSPTPLKRLILERRIRAWVSPSGTARFEPAIPQLHETESIPELSSAERYVQLRAPHTKVR